MQPNGRRALIVVDYQNDFVTGSMGFAKALTLERPIVEKIDAAKQQGVEVLFTLDKHPPATGKAGENQPPMHCVENTEGCALYGAVALYISGRVIDTVLYGMNASKVAYIISDDWKAVADAILAYDRGVTILNAAGAYTGAEKHVLLVAFRQREIVEIKRRVHAIDPGAFLIVCDAHEVLGEGFREYQKEEL